MKIKEIKKIPKTRKGRFNKNGIILEANEERTIKHLTQFGFSIEAIKPSSTKKSKNPDVLISGTIWEIKTPISSNENTIKNRFREASKQAQKIIFDLRFIKNNPTKAEKQIQNLFRKDGNVRRVLIVDKNGKLIDYIK